MVYKPTPLPAEEPTTSTRHPIGVGSDYKPEYHGQTIDPAKTKVRYFTGDERTLVASLSPEDRADLQLTLRSLGLLGSKAKIRLGMWDNKSASAFRQVLAWANANGTGWRAALSDMANSASFGEIGGSEKQAPLPTNSLDIAATGRKVGQEVLGHSLDPEQMRRFESDYRQMEGPYLSGSAGQDAPGSGGMQEWARDHVRALDPVKADSRSAVKVASVISQMLAGNLPSQQLPGEGG